MSLPAAGWRSTLKDRAPTVKSLFACTQKPSRTALVRHMLIVLFLLMGFGVATYVGWQLHQGEQKRWESQVVQWCEERSTMLELDIMTNAKHVEVFTAFVEEFKKEVTEDSSRSQRFLDRTEYARPSVFGVDWSMLVLDEDRSAYEAYWDTTIKDKSTGLSEARQPTYYPITLVSSNLTSLRFFDRQTISLQDNSWQAALKGEFVISPPYPVRDRPSMREFTMCWPTFRQKLSENATPAERVEAVDGVITAVFLFTALVERFLSQRVASQAFSFHVYDVTDPGAPAVLYVPEREVASNVRMERSHSKHVMAMNFGEPSRKHEMWCWYEKRSVGRFSIIWGTFIAVVVVLVACVLWATIRRMEMAEENYQKMEKLKTEAEAADRAKSNFLATMSHELRTPMNGVLGMLNILKETDLDAQQAEYARTASSCANALITLVNDILDLAKVESGHMDLERTPFDFRVICGEVLDIFQEEARKKSVELATLVAPDVPPLVFGDPVRVRQVFINFVGNSLKFTQEGHIFLRISVAKPMPHSFSKIPVSAQAPSSSRAMRESGSVPAKFGTLSGRKAADESNSWEALAGESEVLLGPFWHSPLALKGERRERQSKVVLQCSCEDTGLGIPEGVQHQIFRPFIQAHRSTTREYGGTGIGLSICQKLIGMMGSEIKLVSELGVGSTFYFTLEMDAEARPVGESKEGRIRTRKEQTRRFAQLKGRRTLVAAPRLVRRLVLVNALQALGLEVDVVDSIEDATAVLFQDVLRGEGPDVRTGGTSPESRRRGASGVSAGERAFECLVLDADDWGSDPVLDLAERVWVDHRARGQVADCCTPVVLVAACSFTPEMEGRIGRIPCATKLRKPISSTACGAAITKALGRGTEAPCIQNPNDQHTKRTSVRGIHVLLVDDNLVNQKIVCKMLERSSIAFTAVDRAATAISALVEGHPFDAVLMDIQMPEMDGIEATQIIRAKDVKSTNPAHGRIPIFAMTADVMKDMQVQCREAGMDGFIPKPLDPHKLFDVLAPFFPS